MVMIVVVVLSTVYSFAKCNTMNSGIYSESNVVKCYDDDLTRINAGQEEAKV